MRHRFISSRRETDFFSVRMSSRCPVTIGCRNRGGGLSVHFAGMAVKKEAEHPIDGPTIGVTSGHHAAGVTLGRLAIRIQPSLLPFLCFQTRVFQPCKRYTLPLFSLTIDIALSGLVAPAYQGSTSQPYRFHSCLVLTCNGMPSP